MFILDIASLALTGLGLGLFFRRDMIPARALLLAGSIAEMAHTAIRGEHRWFLINAACAAVWAVLLTHSVLRRRAAQ